MTAPVPMQYQVLEVNEGQRSLEARLNEEARRGWSVRYITERKPIGGAKQFIIVMEKEVQ